MFFKNFIFINIILNIQNDVKKKKKYEFNNFIHNNNK